MKIEVFGAGCQNCHKAFQSIINYLAENNIDADILEITDPKQIAERGILTLPAIFINGQKMLEGRVPDKKLIESWFKE